MGEIYKVFCKGEKGGEPVVADLIVRGVDSRGFALAAVRRYFNQEQPFHGIRVEEGTTIGFTELTDEEREFHGKPELQAIGERVVLVAFYENNPPPDPESYKLPPCGLTDK